MGQVMIVVSLAAVSILVPVRLKARCGFVAPLRWLLLNGREGVYSLLNTICLPWRNKCPRHRPGQPVNDLSPSNPKTLSFS
ncbi:hypothetical protein BC567DRAFT_465 [Phyllosticta citribraziliensis]